MELNPIGLVATQDANAARELAVAAVRRADPSALHELFLRGGEQLQLNFRPRTLGGQLSRGAPLFAHWRCSREGKLGGAAGEISSAAQLDQLAARALAACAEGAASAAPATFAEGHSGGAATLDGERALELARTAAGLLGPEAGPLQALLVNLESPWVVLARSDGPTWLEWRPARERLLLRLETPRGAVLDGVVGSPRVEPRALEAMHARFAAAVDALAAEGGAPAPELPWVLRPAVAAPLISGLSWLLRGDVAERSPGLAKLVGRKVFPQALTLIDGAHAPLPARDDEGQPVAPLTLVDAGQVVAMPHHARSAAALGAKANGRALRLPGSEAIASSPWGLSVGEGALALPASYNELCCRLEMFTHLPKASQVAVIAAGWCVRDGARSHRIAPFELELPVMETLRKLQAVGDDAAVFPAFDDLSTPSLLFATLR